MNIKLLKCVFSFHNFGEWWVPKGAFTSGNEILCFNECLTCGYTENRWIQKGLFKRT